MRIHAAVWLSPSPLQNGASTCRSTSKLWTWGGGSQPDVSIAGIVAGSGMGRAHSTVLSHGTEKAASAVATTRSVWRRVADTVESERPARSTSTSIDAGANSGRAR